MRAYSLILLVLTLVAASSTRAADALDALLAAGRYDEAVARLPERPDHYLARLLAEAERQRLWEHPVWRRLLHYQPTLLGGVESQVDGDDFFLSASGKTDPRAELAATLAGFFSTAGVPPQGHTPQCRFRARHFWLDTQLHFDPRRLPKQSCEKFDFFIQGIRPHGISVVFPAEHPDSPSSMFGHTLLRIDREGQTEATRMLDYTINFAAEAGDTSGVAYAFNGLSGNFEGRFRVIPYYMKLREYAQMENRDIWEYRLDISPEQTRFVLMHAWELLPTYYDYYFFTENCAYHLLSLLEPAMPERELTDAFGAWVLPVDILRVLRDSDMVREVRYYPSRYRVIQTRRGRLSDQDNELALDVFARGLASQQARLDALDKSRQADILDLAYEYRRYAGVASSDVLDPSLSDDERALLLARSRLGIRRQAPAVPEPASSPDAGHRAARLGLGAGGDRDAAFLQLDYRGVYHDWLDPLPGHSNSYALAFGDLALRHYLRRAPGDEAGRLRLRRLHVVRIDNMEPWDGFFRRISWRVVTGAEAVTRNDDRQAYLLRGGPGISLATRSRHLLAWGLLEAEIAAGSAYRDALRLAGGPAAGLMASLGERLRLRASARYLYDARAAVQDSAQLEMGISWSAKAGPSLRLTASRQRLLDGWRNSALASLKFYF